MTTDAQIDLAIDKTHLKTNDKIYPHVVKKHPDVSPERLAAVNKTRPKDKAPHNKTNYYYPIFSNHPYSFQIDLLEQSHDRPEDDSYGNDEKKDFPAYYMIIININTKYAYAIPLDGKDQNTIYDAIKDFVEHHRVISFVSDEESAFKSRKVLNYLTEKGVSLKLINDQRHSALSVIDKFIRTLRDMNTPTVHSKRQSDDPKYRDFSKHRMKKLIKIYNDTIHTSHGHTPQEMENDIKLEKKFIIQKLYQLERRRKITDFELAPDTFVRYILPKDPKKKHRYKVSPEAYKISHRDGNAYTIMAADGTTRTVARWRLFPLGKRLPPKMKFANTFGNNNGTVSVLHDYNPRTGRYDVEFVMPDGSTVRDSITDLSLRGTTPQVPVDIERRFHAMQRNR